MRPIVTITLVLAAAHFSYVLVEAPGQRLGNRVGRALDRRLGRGRPPAGPAHVRVEQREPPRG